MAIPRAALRASRYASASDVWSIFTPLALKHQAVNLGQGFPNLPAHPLVKEGACSAISSNSNQYAPTRGLPRLRKVVAEAYSQYIGVPIDGDANVLVTQGANQGIFAALQAFVNPGEEVILMEPFFDIYMPQIELVGGVPVPMRLRLRTDFVGTISAADWIFDEQDLRRAVTTKTKAIILNTPHNPVGKVFSKAELHTIGSVAREHGLLVISDEVYDQLYFEGGPPARIASDFWDNCVTIGSGGKSFGVTGWRVGWVVGHEAAIRAISAIHTRTVFAVPTPLQEGIATAYEAALGGDFFAEQRRDMKARRDALVQLFAEELRLPVATASGSYFFLVNGERIAVPDTFAPVPGEPEDFTLCRWLTEHVGVTLIPYSAFLERPAPRQKWLRVCFCKSDETIAEATRRLRERLPRFIIAKQ